MDTADLNELIHTEVKTAATQFAHQLYTPLSRQITEQVEEKVREWVEASDADLEETARDIIQPAFLAQVHSTLAGLMLKGHDGWDEITWRNMRENYHAE